MYIEIERRYPMKPFNMELEVEGQIHNVTVTPWTGDRLKVFVDSKGLTETYCYDISSRTLERMRIRSRTPIDEAVTPSKSEWRF